MAEASNTNHSPWNESSSNTSSVITEAKVESLEFKYAKVTFYFVILFCATFGNAMVVYVICTSKRMRSASHLLIMNLAICDFFTPIISIPFDFALEENDYVWFYGDFMCKILYPAATFSTTASSLTLAAISLDRYRVLMHPFKKKLSSKQIKGIIICIYIFCAMLVSPYTYMLNVNDNGCGEKWPGFIYRQLYTMTLFLFQYAIPLVFMTIMYTLAIINLYSTSGKVRHCSIPGTTRKQQQYGDCSVNKSRSKYFKAAITNRFKKKTDEEENPNVKATKMFMAVVVVFAVFMFPNQILWLWVDFGNGSDQPNYAQTAIICWLFTYTNSVVNPIIFAIFSKDFRVGFKGVFRLIFCCNHEALPERCLRSEYHKSDSSTNEMLKDKQNAYDICNTNITMADTLTRDGSPKTRTGLFFPAKDIVNGTGGKIQVNDYAHIETKPSSKVYPLNHSGTRHSPETPRKSLLTNCKDGSKFPESDVDDFQETFLQDKRIMMQNHDKEHVLPILPPNSIAILDELTETDC